MTFLTSCTGIDSRRIEKNLNNSDCLYNEVYGVEFSNLYASCYRSGYITTGSGKLEVVVLWSCAFKKIAIHNKENIDSNLENEDDCFEYFSSESANDNIIISGIIGYDGNIILKVIDSSITIDFDEITLKSK